MIRYSIHQEHCL